MVHKLALWALRQQGGDLVEQWHQAVARAVEARAKAAERLLARE